MASERVSEEAVRAVYAIVRDLTNRRGLRHEWDGIDLDVRDEIVEAWARHVDAALRAERERFARVVEAARRWRKYKPRALATTSTEDALVAAVDDLDREASE